MDITATSSGTEEHEEHLKCLHIDRNDLKVIRTKIGVVFECLYGATKVKQDIKGKRAK
jgi:hypothetical protein